MCKTTRVLYYYIIITCHRVNSFITRHVFHFYVNKLYNIHLIFFFHSIEICLFRQNNY